AHASLLFENTIFACHGLLATGTPRHSESSRADKRRHRLLACPAVADHRPGAQTERRGTAQNSGLPTLHGTSTTSPPARLKPLPRPRLAKEQGLSLHPASRS